MRASTNPEWVLAPKRVRQQSIRYPSGYVQDFDLDIFEYLKVIDFGDAEIPPEVNTDPTADNILKAQAAVEAMVGAALDAGAIPIVIGQNSPCGSYAIAKPIAERTAGKVGMISLDTHWDAKPIDWLTKDARIAGSGNWKTKTYEFHDNFSIPNLVEIGERGMLEAKEIVRHYLERGAHFIPMWKVRTELGIDGLCGRVATRLRRRRRGLRVFRHGRHRRRRPGPGRHPGRPRRTHRDDRLRSHSRRPRDWTPRPRRDVVYLHSAGLGGGLSFDRLHHRLSDGRPGAKPPGRRYRGLTR